MAEERRLNLQKSLIKRVPFIFIKLTQTQPSAPPEASCVNMQWTVTTIIPLVSVILTAVIAPLGWVIQRYWNTKKDGRFEETLEVVSMVLNCTGSDGAKNFKIPL
ncbi:hypothetical protein N8I77_006268 [Diaporthe amygdali]|uniref:Uncharacterized protein n=1 Tax=Phomopsis amygdali TaxID=1214568 RepID=A0AAD9SHL6_PHOAM|nr:hypothetical protein N8I77_006268 [Diaporthe amygdali]